jgi:hypothetical protein
MSYQALKAAQSCAPCLVVVDDVILANTLGCQQLPYDLTTTSHISVYVFGLTRSVLLTPCQLGALTLLPHSALRVTWYILFVRNSVMLHVHIYARNRRSDGFGPEKPRS